MEFDLCGLFGFFSHTFRLMVDASTSDWLIYAWVDDVQLDLNGGAAGMFYNPAANPDIGYVGFSANQNTATSATGFVDDFTLSFTPVPEPSALMLGAVSGLALFRRRRK